ncbi:MAG TPA: cob(I)yrinic acid a,c-diamide adenosyltransferase [Nitrospirota bacterium]
MIYPYPIILHEQGAHLKKGLVIIFTGDGKGKSSAALGVALRALGHKMFVSLVQFIKSPSEAGEARAAERFAPQLEFLSQGKGFVTGPQNRLPLSRHREAAEKALALARQRALSGSWDLLILDEINNAVHLGLLDVKDVLDLVRNKPPKLHMILTGRDAHPDLIAAADLVTEMRVVKHPYDAGVPAQKGIDY